MSAATRHHTADRNHRNWAVVILAALFWLIGLVLVAGGIWLILLDGSWYYAITGIGLIVTGILLHQHRMSAPVLYAVIWLATLGWAWWEVGPDWWAQVPRVVAPTVLLIAILLCIPALRRVP